MRTKTMDEIHPEKVGLRSSDADSLYKIDRTPHALSPRSAPVHVISATDLMDQETLRNGRTRTAESCCSSVVTEGSRKMSFTNLLLIGDLSAGKSASASDSSNVNTFDTSTQRQDPMPETGAHPKLEGVHDHTRMTPSRSKEAMLLTFTSENDTCDTAAPPLHAEVSWVMELPATAFHDSHTVNRVVDTNALAPSARPRLTLSAFRRPEHTVRIADFDSSRKISTEYDLNAPQCRVLGHGGSSTVRLAVRRSDGDFVAVKTIAKHEALRHRRHHHGSRRHLDEWEVLASLRDHPNVTKLLDVFETDDDIQLVMEYCDGGELFDVIQQKRNQAQTSPEKVYRYSERKAARIVSQILSVLVKLHARHICHRDVKPENVLLKKDDESGVMCAKLSDFGTSRELHPDEETSMDDSDSCSSSDGESSPLTPLSRQRAYSTVGSNYYAAPEVCAGEGYGIAVDVYSLGVTLYVLLCGFPPSLVTSDDDDVVSFPSCHWSNISNGVKQLIRKMLEPDVSRRITAAMALQNEWIVRHSQATPGRVIMLSPSATRPVVDMELVRRRLYKGLDESSDEEELDFGRRLSKRRRVESDLAVAMVDFCEGVASAAVAAAAGVFDDGDEIRILDDEDERAEKDGLRVPSPFDSSFTRLSV